MDQFELERVRAELRTAVVLEGRELSKDWRADLKALEGRVEAARSGLETKIDGIRSELVIAVITIMVEIALAALVLGRMLR